MNKVLIYGAGVSAKGAEKLLKKIQINYDVYCDGQQSVLPDLAEYDLVIKSPGIPNDTQLMLAIKAFNIDVIDEIELAFMFSPRRMKIIAITGTNGKTTTTLNTFSILKHLGYKVAYAGNIGVSFAEVVSEDRDLDIVVLELSSYQLEHIKTFQADIAVLLNLTPDHLDRYRHVEEYYQAKWRIFNRQASHQVSILNVGDSLISNSNLETVSEKITFSRDKKIQSDISYSDGYINIYSNMINATSIEKFGKHNVENFLAIVGILKFLGHSDSEIMKCQSVFQCAEHRLEYFLTVDAVDFYNDSKATNSESAKQAIMSLSNLKDIVLICGGKEKNLDLTELVETIMAYPVITIYLIGEMASRMEAALLAQGYKSDNIFMLETLENTLSHLKNSLDTTQAKIVLLSPATSSFDQFKNFEVRGKQFKQWTIDCFKKGECCATNQ